MRFLSELFSLGLGPCICGALFMVSCVSSTIAPKKASVDPVLVDKVKAKQAERIRKLEIYRDPKAGNWVVGDECDGYLWQSKLQAVLCDPEVDIRATEFEGEKGRFGRNPYMRCWTKERADAGKRNFSRSTWSSDMGQGLKIVGLFCQDADLIRDHLNYGRANNWQMGQPWDITTTIYKPHTIREFAEVLHYLTGEKQPELSYPVAWAPGLDDYQAHLQMLSAVVWLEMYSALPENLVNLINAHVRREPKNPLYQGLKAIFSGDKRRALETCLGEGNYGEYVRGRHENRLILIDQIFACNFVLKRFASDN